MNRDAGLYMEKIWSEKRDITMEYFISIMERLIEENASKGGKFDQIYIDQHELFVKFSFHYASIFTLYRGSYFSSTDYKKVAFDYSSLLVLCRSCFENFLTYNFIYHGSDNSDEKKFWYNTWVIDGLNQRQKVNLSHDKELKKKQIGEKIRISELLEEVKSTDCYKKMSEKRKREYDNKLNWPRPGWADLAERAGMDEYWAKMIYSYLSTYAHSASSSVLQFKSATVDNEGKRILDNFMNYIFAISSMYIGIYCSDFGLGATLNCEDEKFLEAWELIMRNLKTKKE